MKTKKIGGLENLIILIKTVILKGFNMNNVMFFDFLVRFYAKYVVFSDIV